MFPNERLWDDFCLFARAQVLSGDIDPMYPVLKRFYAAEKADTEAQLWRTLLYLTWYHVGSAEKVWKVHPRPSEIDHVRFASLPTGVERRGFRGVVGNVQARGFVRCVLRRAEGNLPAWVASFGSGEAGWRSARRELEGVAGAGPWASFKWADLLKNVHGLPLVAPDIGVGGKSETAGPIPGLVALTGQSWKVVAVDVDLQRRVMEEAIKRGVPLGGLDQLETCLCDFNSLIKGGYYVGHDIDLQMTQLDGSGPGLWEARAAFPAAYRGERAVEPWTGVRKELKKRYSQHGELVNLWI
jgi:hypothetical protein